MNYDAEPSKEFGVCWRCDGALHQDETVVVDNNNWCSNCTSCAAAICDYCDNYFESEFSIITADNAVICESCCND